MCKIIQLEWDSNFFDYEVGKLYIPKNGHFEISVLPENEFKLIYLFSEEPLSDHKLKSLGAQLVDVKVELAKSTAIMPLNFNDKNTYEVKPINELSNSLISLVLESGVYSRFKLDQNFIQNEYERLYIAWIKKALEETNSKVYGAYLDTQLLGFISLSMKSGIADIGLIAVYEKARGMHIGKILLHEANNYANNNDSSAITVVTQEKNEQAMAFYIKNGFSVQNKTYTYHLWKKNQ